MQVNKAHPVSPPAMLGRPSPPHPRRSAKQPAGLMQENAKL